MGRGVVKVAGDLYGLGDRGRRGLRRDKLRDLLVSGLLVGAGVGWRRRSLGSGGRLVDCAGVNDGGGLLRLLCVGGDLLRWLRLLALVIGDGLRCLGLPDLERRGLELLRRGIV